MRRIDAVCADCGKRKNVLAQFLESVLREYGEFVCFDCHAKRMEKLPAAQKVIDVYF